MNLVDEAVIYASNMHKGMVRKTFHQPYVYHPLEVLSLASILTDDENILAAAILHDTVEDTPATIEEIYLKFGKEVGDIVKEESEDKREGVSKSNSWRIRKQETINLLNSSKNLGAKIVCLCDKTSNLRSLHMSYLQIGEEVWDGFNNKNPLDHFWYYDSIRNSLSELGHTPVYKEYSFLIDVIFNKYLGD